MAAVGSTNPVARWQRLGLDATLITLLVSGLFWLLVHYAWGAGNGESLPHWSEAWLIRAHGLAAFFALIAVGAFLPVHVPRGWRLRTRRGLEITMLVCLGLAVVSAYLLYYFAPDWLRPSLGWVHAVVGCAWGATVVMHRTLSPSSAERGRAGVGAKSERTSQ